MQAVVGEKPPGGVFPSSGVPGAKLPGAVLTAEDHRVFDELKPSREVWALWLAARRRTVDPQDDRHGWPLHVALVLEAWEQAASRVLEASNTLSAALRRALEARERRDRRARAYRALLSEAGRTWTIVSTAMAEYADACDRASKTAAAVQAAQVDLFRALWWAEALVRSGLVADALLHMRVARRAVQVQDVGAWDVEPPPDLPPPPPVTLPEPRVQPKKRGPFAVLRQTTGAWIVVDARRPMGNREVFRAWGLREANDELDLRAQAEGVPLDDL